MREAKKYLVTEVEKYLDKAEYFFLADYQRMSVAETSNLRQSLRAQNAEFHVVKNRIFKHVAREHKLPELNEALKGQTAIITGGSNPSEVAKIIQKFFKDKEKLAVKGGVMANKALSAGDVDALSKLPSLEVCRAQFLALLNTPATQMARVLQAAPQSMLNVLQAKSRA